MQYGIRRRDSTIPGAGKGVFATAFIPDGHWICPYVGESINQNCLESRYPGDQVAPYAVDDGRRRYIDSACLRGIGSIANGLFDAAGSSRPQDQHNAIIEARPDGSRWLRATRDIPDGSEIFVWYGDAYTLEDNHQTKRRRRDDTRPC